MPESFQYRNCFDIELFEGSISSNEYPWHYHDSYTIVLVEKGEMHYVFRDREVTVKAGEAMIVSPYVSHRNYPLSDCRYKVIFLPVKLLLHDDPGSLVLFQLQSEHEKSRVSVLSGFYEAAKNAKSRIEFDELADAIRYQLLTNFQCCTRPVVFDKRVIPAIEFINQNLDEKLTISALARQCYLSPFHFQRIFKSSTGLTVKDYIQQQRTERAKDLLQAGKPIADTAFETGYFDQSHFYKSFRKMWGATPASIT